jgi:hypothetical protein
MLSTEIQESLDDSQLPHNRKIDIRGECFIPFTFALLQLDCYACLQVS